MADNKPDLPSHIPNHVAIVMDGNGRWAKKRGLPRLAGHRAGTENIREIIRACVEFGVKILTIYAFSTENWTRPEDEVKGLMHIFEDVFDRELAQLHKEGAQLRHLGSLENVKASLREKVENGIELTKDNDRLILYVAFNYGGRDDIVQAVHKIIAEGLDPESIDEQMFSKYLYTKDCPDPDLVIRTSGEFRLSNFLVWQSAYSEWIFPEEFWPDFGRNQLLTAIQEYSQRERRYGGLVAD